MRVGWQLDPAFARGAAARAFGSLDAVFALEGELVASDTMSEVLRLAIDGRRYYVKRYRRAAKNPLRRWLGRSRIRTEWENLRHFQAWGIPTAKVVAFGQERGVAGFSRGALVTAEIPHTTDLARMAATGDPRLADRRWVAHVSRQLATAARSMHSRRFAHNDLKWRNLLVDDGPQPTLFLIDCPSGEFWVPPFLEYRVVKDLACLDKVAKYHLSRTQRLRFYLDYAGRRRLAPADKQRIRRILAFFEGRE